MEWGTGQFNATTHVVPSILADGLRFKLDTDMGNGKQEQVPQAEPEPSLNRR